MSATASNPSRPVVAAVVGTRPAAKFSVKPFARCFMRCATWPPPLKWRTPTGTEKPSSVS